MGSIPIVEHTDPALWPAEKHYLNGPAMHGHPLLVVRNWTELSAIFEKYRDTALLEEKSAEIRRWWISFKVQLQINVSLLIEKGFTPRISGTYGIKAANAGTFDPQVFKHIPELHVIYSTQFDWWELYGRMNYWFHCLLGGYQGIVILHKENPAVDFSGYKNYSLVFVKDNGLAYIKARPLTIQSQTVGFFHIGDEVSHDNIDYYESSAFILRNYYDYSRILNNTLWVPLGYFIEYGFRGGHDSILPNNQLTRVSERRLWCNFFGNTNNKMKSRLQLIVVLTNITSKNKDFRCEYMFNQRFKSGLLLEIQTYKNRLLESVFTLCPDGRNPETHRLD